MIAAILHKLPRSRGPHLQFMQSFQACAYATKTKGTEIPVNVLKDVYSASNQSGNGHIYDKKPFKLRCEAGKNYSWCLCGRSKSQPLCDGTHRSIYWKITLKPIRFQVKETKDYWLCNCKQTSNRPFCDGTHLREDIQEKSRTGER